MKKVFSIIVPVYNVECYLKKCIKSILEQTFKNYELILVNDGSTDRSGMVCDEFSEVDERVIVIHQKNSGVSEARNAGVDIAEGKYVIFLDSDDYWHDENVLQKLYDRLVEFDSDVLSFNYVKVSKKGEEKPYFNEKKNMIKDLEKTLSYLVENNLWVACSWNKVVKRELFDKRNLYFKKGITSEDIDWCLRLALRAKKFDYLNDVIVCYRQRANSISKAVTVQKIDTLLSNIEYCLSLVQNEEEKVLQPYIAYQYGTLVYLISMVKERDERKRLLNKAQRYRYLLKESGNRKVKLIRIVDQIGGLRLAICILRFRR